MIGGRGVMDSMMHGGVHSVMDGSMMSHVVDRDRVSQGVRSVVTMSHNSAVMSVVDHVRRDVSRGGRVGQSNQSQHTRKSLHFCAAALAMADFQQVVCRQAEDGGEPEAEKKPQ